MSTLLAKDRIAFFYQCYCRHCDNRDLVWSETQIRKRWHTCYKCATNRALHFNPVDHEWVIRWVEEPKQTLKQIIGGSNGFQGNVEGTSAGDSEHRG